MRKKREKNVVFEKKSRFPLLFYELNYSKFLCETTKPNLFTMFFSYVRTVRMLFHAPSA
jgi:hypothetical protein